MARNALRIGFDFDGVIAYNPLRVFRRPAMWALHLLRGNKKELKFPIPNGFHNELIWGILHETSFFPSYGFSDLKQLLKDKKITAYVISGRYSFLKPALIRWLKFRQVYHYFDGLYMNEKDEQPHLFKEKMIKKLKLDMFVEDNLDIVNYLHSEFDPKKSPSKDHKNVEIHWIYNFLDRNVKYPYKHPYMKGFTDYLQKRGLV